MVARKPPPRIKRKLPPNDLALIRRYANRPGAIPTPWGVWDDPARGSLPPLPPDPYAHNRYGEPGFGTSGWDWGNGPDWFGEQADRGGDLHIGPRRGGRFVYGIQNWDPRWRDLKGGV